MSEDDKELPEEIIKSEKPAGRFRGRWNSGFDDRHESERPLAPKGGGKAEAEHVHRPGQISKVEEYRVAGHVKLAGKHVSADGLVSRSGRRRIAPEDLLRDNAERDWQIDELKRLAKKALRGRNATVFRRSVLEPLEGIAGATYRQLADQFGCSITTIHRIIGTCHMRIAEALEAERKAVVGVDRCPTCGFVYGDSPNELPCARGYAGRYYSQYVKGAKTDIHPECARRFVPRRKKMRR